MAPLASGINGINKDLISTFLTLPCGISSDSASVMTFCICEDCHTVWAKLLSFPFRYWSSKGTMPSMCHGVQLFQPAGFIYCRNRTDVYDQTNIKDTVPACVCVCVCGMKCRTVCNWGVKKYYRLIEVFPTAVVQICLHQKQTTYKMHALTVCSHKHHYCRTAFKLLKIMHLKALNPEMVSCSLWIIHSGRK